MMAEKSLSFSELAKLTDLTSSNIKRVSQNEHSASIDILLIIGKELGYELAWKKIEGEL